MLPTDYNDGLVQDFTIKTQPTLTYRLRFDGRPAGGMLNGTEAMKQAARICQPADSPVLW